MRHSAHSQCVPAVQMIWKSIHGSFAPELARPSSCSHSTERTFIQSLRIPSASNPLPNTRREVPQTRFSIYTRSLVQRHGLRFSGDLRYVATQRARPRISFGCRIPVVSSPISPTLPQSQIMADQHRQPPAGPPYRFHPTTFSLYI